MLEDNIKSNTADFEMEVMSSGKFSEVDVYRVWLNCNQNNLCFIIPNLMAIMVNVDRAFTFG